jgi:hypothetical protein
MASSGAAGSGDEPLPASPPAGTPFSGPKLLNVILDIDETFVHFVGIEDWANVPEADKPRYATTFKEGRNKFYILRPGIEKFFQFLDETCKSISFWTLSDKGYAMDTKALIESTIKNTKGKPIKISNVWVDDDNEAAEEEYGNTKELQYIWDNYKQFTPANTILVDDVQINTQNPANKYNGIQILPFNPLGKRAKEVTTTKMRTGPYKNMLDDTELERVADIIRGAADELCTKSRPFCKPQALDVNPAHGGRRKTRRKARKVRKTRKTKTRR